MPLQGSDQLPRQRTEIDIGTIGHPRSCNRLSYRLGYGPLLHHQRHPFGNDGRVFAIFHIGEQMMTTQLCMTLPEKSDILLTPDEALMWRGIDEGLR